MRNNQKLPYPSIIVGHRIKKYSKSNVIYCNGTHVCLQTARISYFFVYLLYRNNQFQAINYV